MSSCLFDVLVLLPKCCTNLQFLLALLTVLLEHGRRVLRSNICRTTNNGLERSLHSNGKHVDSFACKPLNIKLHSFFHTMACEGLHKGSSGEGVPSESLIIDIGGSTIDVVRAPSITETDMRRAVDSVVFKQWLFNLKRERGVLTPATDGGASCSLKRVTIQSVDMFGQRVGFVKFKAEVTDDCTGKMARVPVGRVILELPAGMADDDAGDFVGTAAREVEEEVGIHIKTADLINLTTFLDKSTGCRMFPSPGGCDEEITLMLYRSHVKREVIDSLQGQKTGLEEHGEFIKVRVVPYSTLWRSTADSKVLAAITLYEMAKKEGVLPPPPNAPHLANL